jgi:ADP-ribose pyrophosphatase YjhB (NUDIX family)
MGEALVTCYDDQGRPTAVPAASLLFRVAAYGVLIENNQVLLCAHPVTMKWQLPGGPISGNEKPDHSVRLRFQAVAGITPAAGPLLLAEDRYHFDSDEQAWRLAVLYYGMLRPSAAFRNLIDFDNPARPEWVSLESLQREQMALGYDAVEAGRLRLLTVSS